MRLHQDYTISTIAGDSFLLPLGASVVNVNNMLDLNETSAFIVELLKNDISFEELVEKVFEEFEADKDVITADVKEFIETGKKIGFIVE